MNDLIGLLITSSRFNRVPVVEEFSDDKELSSEAEGQLSKGGAVKVLIAEDQAEHAAWLGACLKKLRPQWKVSCIVTNVSGLANSIEEHAPDLLLLDVNIEGGSTIDMVAALSVDLPVIFVSGAVECAAAAFDCAARDFVPKPVRAARLEKALIRFSESRANAKVPPAQVTADWLAAYRDKCQVVVHFNEILYLQSHGKYTRVVTVAGDAHVRKGLGHIEKGLDARMFFRIHRGIIINMHRARNLARDEMGRLRVQFEGGNDWVQVGKAYEKLFRDF